MASLFNNLVRFGVDHETPPQRYSEIKLINSISIHAILLALVSGVVGVIFLERHALFLATMILTEVIAKFCVLVLNMVHRYVVAKLIFSFTTLFIFIIVIAYFGIESNFQYLIMTMFFILVVIFKDGSTENSLIKILYLGIGVGAVGILYLLDDPINIATSEEYYTGRFIAFSINIALIIMVAVVYSKWSYFGHKAVLQDLEKASGVANILNTISKNMNDGIFKVQPESGFVYVNAAFSEMFGYESEEELMAEHPERIYDNVADRNELIDEIMARGAVTNRLIHYRRKNGARFWGRVSCRLIQEQGIDYLVGTVSDVTTQQEQEALLLENEEQLKEAQRIAKIGNWQLFNATKIFRWSDECMRIHGYNSVQVDYDFQEWLDRLEDIDEARMNTLMAKAMMSKENVQFGSWYITPEGERKYLTYITRYQRSDKIKGGVWFGTVQDFTLQHLAEERILETKQFYESWIDVLPIESVIFDEKKRYTYVSKSAIADQKLRHWLLGKTNADYAKYRGLTNSFSEQRNAMLDKIIETNEPVKWEEHMTRKDGTSTFHLRYLLPMEIKEHGKSKRRFVGFSFDLNEIKQAEVELVDMNSELTRVNKELDRFVYSISHDLRAPVASLLGLVNLADEAEDEEERNQMVAMQRESLERMDQYIRDLIDYSRNKRLSVEAVELNLPEVIDKCIDELRYFMDDERVRLETDLKVTTMVSDPTRFMIIVKNLLSNAAKYGDPQKETHEIFIKTKLEGDRVVLEVSDNGIGIKEQFLEQIWEMFFRATTESAGSGLGLYILKEAAHGIGAMAEVRSEEGLGSTFIVTFPQSMEEET